LRIEPDEGAPPHPTLSHEARAFTKVILG
jgi:hypothetical protein